MIWVNPTIIKQVEEYHNGNSQLLCISFTDGTDRVYQIKHGFDASQVACRIHEGIIGSKDISWEWIAEALVCDVSCE